MKALTLWQPYATLVAAGVKTVETRSWGTTYRGVLAIHAARKWDQDILDDYEEAAWNLRKCWGLQFRRPECIVAGNLNPASTLGCILAVAHLVDCRPMLEAPDAQEAFFGNYGEGRWGWVLEGVKPLPEPVACRGAQQLWNVPQDVALLLPEPFPLPPQRTARQGYLFDEGSA